MLPPRLRQPNHLFGHFSLAAALAAACAMTVLASTLAPAAAQGWDPFSQLDTDRTERRSKSRDRRPETPRQDTADPANSAPQDAYRPPASGQQNYADPSGGQTYYPPSSAGQPPAGQPNYERNAPNAGTATRHPSASPSSVSVETLAPLPSAPSPAASPTDAPYSAGYPGPAQSGAAYPGAANAPPSTAPYGNPQPGGSQSGDAKWPGSNPGSELAVRQPEARVSDEGTAGTALPNELWRGLETASLERLITSLDLPPKSPALHQLWRRLLVSDTAAPSGGETNAHFEALRLEALYRSGLMKEIRDVLNAQRSGPPDPLVTLLEARNEIGIGHRDAGCEAVKKVGDIRGEIPKPLRGEAILVSGYCAAATGNKAAAGLLASLAREEGIRSSPGLAALDAVALGVKTDISLAKGQKLSLIDYRILELAGATPPRDELIKTATPALLVAVANDTAADADLRLDAGEAAARINAYDPDALASLYRATASQSATGSSANEGPSSAPDTSRRRALVYASAQAERTPFKKVRLIRNFIDSSRRAGLYLPALAMAAKLTDDVGLVPEIGWFAETAIASNLASGNYQNARKWAKFAASAGNERGQNMDHWMALIDIADPQYPEPRGQHLAALERLALKGQFSHENLHRLATVLDALEYNVPIPLWEAASKTPQPTTGHLPATGVLPQLQDAAKKREFGHTVLLAMQTLGPDSADDAHIIALGDSIRALKRAGLEPDARRLGFEALIPNWPNVLTN